MQILNDENFVPIAIALYQNPQCCTDEEFLEDLARFKYLKKLITRYIDYGELKDRLILNHLVVLNNVFGPTYLARMLYFKMTKQFYCIKPFLELLNIMPKYIENVRVQERIDGSTIISDPVIVEKLKAI